MCIKNLNVEIIDTVLTQSHVYVPRAYIGLNYTQIKCVPKYVLMLYLF